MTEYDFGYISNHGTKITAMRNMYTSQGNERNKRKERTTTRARSNGVFLMHMNRLALLVSVPLAHSYEPYGIEMDRTNRTN